MSRKGKILCLVISISMLIVNFMSFLACTHVMSMVVQITIIFDMAIWGFMVMAFYELVKKGDE